MKKTVYFILLSAATFLISCASNTTGIDAYTETLYKPSYASGFEIVGAEGRQSTLLKVFNPWQGAENTETTLFIVRNGVIKTPPLTAILDGITRDSIIKLAKHKGIPVDERRITVQDVFDAADNGTLEEAFGSGTAAVVSPVGRLAWKDREISISGGQIGKLTQDFYDTLTGIQYGDREDPFGWVVKIS